MDTSHLELHTASRIEMSGPIVIPMDLVLAIGFGIDIVLAILGINVFKMIKGRVTKAMARVH